MLYARIQNEIKNGFLYDFIANHYWELSKEQLRDIILELEFEMTCNKCKKELEAMWEKIANSFGERYGD